MVKQLVRFGIVGIICFILDYSILILLKEILNINVLIANVISFSLSTIINYLFSINWVFNANNKKEKFIIFVIFSILALILTEAIMWFGITVLEVDYKIVKVVSTGIVMCFNFITRKKFLESTNFKYW